MATRGTCPVCHGIVATDASSCPHCGTTAFSEERKTIGKCKKCPACNGHGHILHYPGGGRHLVTGEYTSGKKYYLTCSSCNAHGGIMLTQSEYVDLRTGEVTARTENWGPCNCPVRPEPKLK